jgi:hypothetical protein
MLGVVLAVALQSQYTSQDLSLIAQQSAEAVMAKFPDRHVMPSNLGITISSLNRSNRSVTSGSFRGDQNMYPASVVKLFHLAYAAERLESKAIQMTPELERAIQDMVVESTNDATALVVDTITRTTGGPELDAESLKDWMARRQSINRWFEGMKYPPLNACQKTWNEGPYGRERQGYGPNFELRNSLSPDACARLMSEIALDKIVSPAKCAWMRKLLARNPLDTESHQASAYTGKVLGAGAKLFSKAGWTSTVTHDVAYVVVPDGREFVMAIFTRDQGETTNLVPAIAREILSRLHVPVRDL